jgi:hypothetical protein
MCDYCGEELDTENVWMVEGVTVVVCSFCESMLEEYYDESYLPSLDVFEYYGKEKK